MCLMLFKFDIPTSVTPRLYQRSLTRGADFIKNIPGPGFVRRTLQTAMFDIAMLQSFIPQATT